MDKPKQSDYIIAGNWKMNKTVNDSIDFVVELDKRVDKTPRVEILVFPPFTSLYPLKGISDKIKIGAQNIFYEEKGAYTGEISAIILENLVEFVLIGHSERRQIFNESDIEINRKVRRALDYGFRVVLCVGETLDEREGKKTLPKIKMQIEKNLEGVDERKLGNLIIAYEPIWAIGTGKTATPEQAQDVHAFIRETLKKYVGDSQYISILYGGSVKPENSQEILSQIDINGVLVGGASLNVDSFFDIIKSSIKLSYA